MYDKSGKFQQAYIRLISPIYNCSLKEINYPILKIR